MCAFDVHVLLYSKCTSCNHVTPRSRVLTRLMSEQSHHIKLGVCELSMFWYQSVLELEALKDSLD